MYNAPPLSALPFTNVMPCIFTLLAMFVIVNILDLPSASKTVPPVPIIVIDLPIDMALFRLLVYVIPLKYIISPAIAPLIAV